jgi:hypothetical protein
LFVMGPIERVGGEERPKAALLEPAAI